MRKQLLLLIFMAATAAMMAHPVSQDEALLKAKQFMPTKLFNKTATMPHSRRLIGNRAPFYIFNDENGSGFVIVSGDDRTEPILGYADRGAIDANDMPDNLSYWLDGYAEQIQALADDEQDIETFPMVRASNPAIAPLISTTWNQGLPYNLMTPTYINDNGVETHYVTGCTATAIAQVLNYHQWPKYCPAIPAYTTGTLNIYRPELSATTFKWDLMKDRYSSQETGEAADAVAELMVYVGQVNLMNYNVDGSSASVHLDVMANYFSYSKNAHSAYRDDYSVAEWENLIYRELACNRPVLYYGAAEGVAHEFICDGYDGNGFFHFNWGWGGHSDGFFVISLANPEEKGIGGGDGTGGYAFGQSAVIGFQPASDNEPERPSVGLSTNNLETTSYSRSSSQSDFEDVSTIGCYFYVSYYSCTPTTTCDIEIGWALYQGDEVVNVLASEQINIDCRDLKPGYTRTYLGPETITFGAGLGDGNYKIVPVYRYLGDSDWITISTKRCIYAEITGNTLSVRGMNLNVSYIVNSVDYSGEMAEGTKVNVVINITNTSDAMRESAYFWIRQNNVWKLVGRGIGSVEPGETGNINLSFTPEKPGTFDVRISTDSKGEKVMGTSTVIIYAIKEVTYKGLKFACHLGTKEAKLIKGDYSSFGWTELEIPSAVRLDGIDYPVRKIDNRAFYNISSLRKVVIPEGLQYIGERAFLYCYSLQEIHLPSTLKGIGEQVFDGCSSLNAVVSYMEEPISINRNVFTSSRWIDDETVVEKFTSATLYVPIGTKETYQSSEAWGEFETILQGEPREITLSGITYSYATGEDMASIVRCDEELLEEQDVVIPSTIEADGRQRHVESISKRVFLNINSLRKVVIPEGLQYIEAEAFQYCYGLHEVYLPSTLKGIGERAFGNCGNLNAVVSYMEEPISINRNVFTFNNWIDEDTMVEEFISATLYVPQGTKETYQSAEVWSEFGKILQGEPREITLNGIIYSYATGEDFVSIVRCDEYFNEQDVVIPSTIEADGRQRRVESISPWVFWNVNSLRKVVFSEGLQYIGERAFQYCYGLQEIYLPSTLKVIGEQAFDNCNNLNVLVSYMEEPISINRNVFTSNRWIDDDTVVEEFISATLYVPEGAKEKYQSAEVWSEFETILQGEPREITLEGITYSYVTGEEAAAIVGCDVELLREQDVVIPSTIEADGRQRHVESISPWVFNQCGMKSLTIESGIKRIENGAFWNISSLRKVVFPEGLEYIGERAFEYCSGLQEIYLPSTLKGIGEQAFGGCGSLNTVLSYMEGPISINRNVFTFSRWVDDDTLVEEFTSATLYVLEGAKEAYQSSEAWNEFEKILQGEPREITLEGITCSYATGEEVAVIVGCDVELLREQDVVIPSTIEADGRQRRVESISPWVFIHCEMKSLTIEPGMKKIENGAFWNISSLRKVVFPEGLEYIGERAFQYCYGLQEIHLPSTLKGIGEQAFGGCNNLNVVVSYMEEPISINRNVFTFNRWIDDKVVEEFTSATLYVPEESMVKYRTSTVWREFGMIKSIDTLGIHHVLVDEESLRIFDINGRHLETPRKGFNIINGKKILIK